jgi:zinc/manganese transport system substrate-binding protein
MKKILLTLLFFSIITTAYAKVRVVTAYPYIADLARKIGGNAVDVKALAPGNWDPHTVVPRPSYIAKVRNADLLIINGAELEIGWIPPIIRESRNYKVQPGASGFLDLSVYAHLIDKPDNISRALGDVHPSGNPHYALGPENIPKIAGGIYQRLCKLDSANCQKYKKNLDEFNNKWTQKLEEWKKKISQVPGLKIVQYHKLFNYLCKYFGITIVMEIEPLPGIPPASGHIEKVIKTVRNESVPIIATDVYHPIGAAKFVSDKTGARLVVLPQDVHAVDGVDDIFSLYDVIVRRLTND